VPLQGGAVLDAMQGATARVWQPTGLLQFGVQAVGWLLQKMKERRTTPSPHSASRRACSRVQSVSSANQAMAAQ
jgi:hypothetical protein